MQIKMKLASVAALLLLPFCMNAAALSGSTPPMETQSVHGVLLSETVALSAEDIMAGNRKVLEAKLGKKLSLKERVALRVAKHQLKRAEKKGQLEQTWGEVAVNDDGGNFVLGILLGLLLGLIGVLIALIWGNSKAIRGSLIGCLALIIIILLAI